MLTEHMNFNRKDWEELMWINDNHRGLFGSRKFYFSNPYYDVFRNMYFKDRVAVPSKCFVFR